MDILRDLFDEKIIAVINLFMDNPEKRYCLTDVSNMTKVNIATTFRILNKLIVKGFIKTIIIGKIRIYQLEKNEKTRTLSKFLKHDDDYLQEFIDMISMHPRIKKVLLEYKDKTSAKVIIVGEFLPTDKINKAIEEIRIKRNYKINVVELTDIQFKGLREFKNYNLDKKIIWEQQQNPQL